jgi:hypothetical protein
VIKIINKLRSIKMKAELNEITVNGVVYTPKGNEEKKAESFEGMEYKIIRTYSAGVFAGYVESRNGKEAVIRKARRLWYWEGAASLSQLAVDGVSIPENCKFPCEVDKIELLEVIEVLSVTEKSKKSIAGVKVWQV